MAFVGDARRLPSARHFASYLGLTPRERSIGLRRRLGAISKRGDAAIALANKLARILCEVWRRDVEFTAHVQEAARFHDRPDPLKEEDRLLAMGCSENDVKMACRS